jgi:hypothetical protein
VLETLAQAEGGVQVRTGEEPRGAVARRREMLGQRRDLVGQDPVGLGAAVHRVG